MAGDSFELRLDDARLGGALLALSGIVFMLLNTVAESIFPDYSVRTDALSTLGGTGQSTTLLWDGQLFVSGLLGLAGLYLLLVRGGVSRRVGGKLWNAVYFLPALGTITVSLVPWNTVIAIHSLGAFVTFIFGGIAAIYSSRFTRRPFAYLGIVLGLVSLLSIPLLVQSSPYLGFGGAERLVVYPYVLWQVAFGAYWTSSSG